MTNKHEKIRRSTKQKEFLDFMRMKGSEGTTNAELSSKGFLRYGAYIGRLYILGYKFNKKHLGNGLVKYTLVHEPLVETEPKKAIDVLLEEVALKGKVDSEQLSEILNEIGITVRYKPFTFTQREEL